MNAVKYLRRLWRDPCWAEIDYMLSDGTKFPVMKELVIIIHDPSRRVKDTRKLLTRIKRAFPELVAAGTNTDNWRRKLVVKHW
jgi:hypothetical protein